MNSKFKVECINEKVDMSYSSYKAGNIPTSGGGCFKQLLRALVISFQPFAAAGQRPQKPRR